MRLPTLWQSDRSIYSTDSIDMGTAARILSVLIIASALAGCRTTTFVQPPVQEQLPEVVVPGKLNGYFMTNFRIAGEQFPATMQRLREGVETAALNGYNSIFLKPESILSEYEEVGDYFTDLGRHFNLKTFFIIDLVSVLEEGRDVPFHELKSIFKNRVADLALTYPIDGLCFQLPIAPGDYLGYEGFSEEEFRRDNLITGVAREEWVISRVTDLLEDAVAGAMLVKPYLINTVISVEPAPQRHFSLWLETGIADAVIPGFPNGGVQPDPAQYLYPEKISINYRLKQITPQQVIGLDLSKLFTGSTAGEKIILSDSRNRVKIADSNGMIGFISQVTDSIRFETSQGRILISMWDWSVPYNYSEIGRASCRERV